MADPPIKPLADAIIELQLQLSNVALTYGHVSMTDGSRLYQS